jgi:hypothetical protein
VCAHSNQHISQYGKLIISENYLIDAFLDLSHYMAHLIIELKKINDENQFSRTSDTGDTAV